MGSDTSLRVFLYPRMTHAKVMLVDGVIAAVGSANLTPRSMLTSKEATLFLSETETVSFIQELRERLAADIAESESPGSTTTWSQRINAESSRTARFS